MKRNIIAVVALEGRQWEWAVYQVGGGAFEKLRDGITPLTDDSGGLPSATAIEARRDALLDQWREQRVPYTGARLVLGMATSDALMRVIDLPTRDPDELHEMSSLQVEKTSPFSGEQTAAAYELLASHAERSLVLSVGANLERIEQYGHCFRDAGLKPKRVDVNLCGRWRTLTGGGDSGDTGRVARLLVRDDACDAIVTDQGVPLLLREQVRRDGLSDADYAAEIVSQTSYSLASCDLEHGPSTNLTIEVLYDGEQSLPGLEDSLRQAVTSQVSSRPTNDLPGLCEGLARRATDHQGKLLNLAPDNWRQAEIDRARKRRLLSMFATAAALWILAVGGLYGSLMIERRRLTGMEQQYALMEPEYNATTNTRQRVRNLRQYTDQTHSALESLRDISARQPDGVNLSSFDYRKGSMIRIVGDAENAAQIYDFKNELDNSSLFTDLDLSSIARSARDNRETFRMNIHLPDHRISGDSP